MATNFPDFAALSDAAKYLCAFQFQGKSPILIFNQTNSFFGGAYDAALAELKASGIISENGPASPFTAAYDVHFDLSEAVMWFVSQSKDYRDQISANLCRRPADDRDIAKAIRCIDHCLELIGVKDHPSFSHEQILSDIERRLKSTLNEICGPAPAISTENNKARI